MLPCNASRGDVASLHEKFNDSTDGADSFLEFDYWFLTVTLGSFVLWCQLMQQCLCCKKRLLLEVYAMEDTYGGCEHYGRYYYVWYGADICLDEVWKIGIP